MLGFGRTSLHISGESPFDPTKIPGLAAWWRSDLGIGLVGGYVETWTDQVNELVATQDIDSALTSYRPTAGPNGVPVVGDGHSFWSLSNFVTDIVSSGSSRTTIWAGMVSSGVPPQGFVITCHSTAPYAAFGHYISGVDYAISSGIANSTISYSPPLNVPLWNIYTYELGSLPTLEVNGVSAGTFTGNSPTDVGGAGGFQIGVNRTGQYWSNDVYEIIVYDRVLIAGEIDQLNTYLSGRYST